MMLTAIKIILGILAVAALIIVIIIALAYYTWRQTQKHRPDPRSPPDRDRLHKA